MEKKTSKTVKIVTVTGSAGVGKTSIVGRLMKMRPDIGLILSLTSREPRPTDLPREYRCNVTSEEFSKKENFIWVRQAHGNTYGTLYRSVDESLVAPMSSLMILIPGVVKRLHHYVESMHYKNGVISIFISTPPEEELRRRMKLRGEDPQLIERRIIDCRQWEKDAKKSDIPYIFVSNDEPDIGIEKAARKILGYIE